MTPGYHYTVTDEQLEEFQKWSIEERLHWVVEVNHFLRLVQTREERINAYRLKAGKNLKYYEQFGWPEQF